MIDINTICEKIIMTIYTIKSSIMYCIFDFFILDKVRTKTNALGFYVFFLMLIVLSAGLLSLIMTPHIFEDGILLGQTYATICCALLSFGILHKKNQLKNLKLLFILILSFTGTMLSGALLGLVFVTFLTTTDKLVLSNDNI